MGATAGAAPGLSDSATAVLSGVCAAEGAACGAAGGATGAGADGAVSPPGVCAIPLGGPSFARFSFARSSSISRIAFSITARFLGSSVSRR